MAPQVDIRLEEGPGAAVMESSALSQTSYAHSRRVLNEAVKQMRNCGAEAVIQLPMIVCIGNQSAGKSSILEAISQIKLPRDRGTCTRCPLEVILSSGSHEWKSTISLRFESGMVVRFDETRDRDQIPLILRRAQLAALNPHKNAREYVKLDEQACKSEPVSTPFSRSTVVVEISGSDVDVTFIDLPGIISYTEKPEDEIFISLIESLVESYVSQGNCLILLTVTMKEDIECQSAMRIARKWDPNGQRTIGVLTKADLVLEQNEGECDKWLKIMNGQSHVLRRGYYITRMPAPTKKEMDLTPKQIRDKEAGTFSRPPWNHLNKNRVGVDMLTEALSEGLAGMIRERLPALQEELSLKMKKIHEDLDGLPESFEDSPQAKFLHLCRAFNTEVDEHVTAKSSRTQFFRDLQDEFSDLEMQIRKTKPKFQPVPEETSSKELLAVGSERTKQGKADKEADYITLEAIREIIKEQSVRRFTDDVPYAVFEHFNNQFVSKWTVICLESFSEIEYLLKELLLDDVCVNHFGRFSSSGLLQEVKAVIKALLVRTAQETKRKIRFYCKMECNRPFTMSDQRYKDSKSGFRLDFAGLRNHRRESQRPDVIHSTLTVKRNGNSQSVSSLARNEDEQKTLITLLLNHGYPITSTRQLARLFEPDNYEAELDIMSRVLAYFEISSNRIIDVMPMIFETAFVCESVEELAKVLTSELKLIGEFGFETCKRYGKDEPDIQVKREDYRRQADILSDAMSIISKFFKGK